MLSLSLSQYSIGTITRHKVAVFAVAALLSQAIFISITHAQSLEVSAAKELYWDQNQGFYQATGDAIAKRGTQMISADQLTAYYDSTDDNQDITRVIADTNAAFEDADLNGKGAKLTYDVAADIYHLEGPDAVVDSKDGVIKADNLIHYDRQSGFAELRGNAEITMADGRVLRGDILEIMLNDSEEITKVTANGNVFVKQTDTRQAEANEGIYDAEKGTALLTGDVKIIDGASILNGQKAEIDFNNGTSRLLSSGNSGRVSGILSTN